MIDDQVMVMKKNGEPILILDCKNEEIYMPLPCGKEDVPVFFLDSIFYIAPASIDLQERVWVSIDKAIEWLLSQEVEPKTNEAVKTMLYEKKMMLERWEQKKKEVIDQDTH